MPKPTASHEALHGARKADRATESGAMPSKEAMARTDAVIEEMKKAGVLVASIGLAPAPRARVHASPTAAGR